MSVEEEYGEILQKCPLELIIQPLMTIKELKLKAFEVYNIPIELQCWLLNDNNLHDDDSLFGCGAEDELISSIRLYINKQSKKDEQVKVSLKLIMISETELDNEIAESDTNTDHIARFDGADDDDLLDEAASLPILDIIKTELPLDQYQEEVREDENNTWKCGMCTLINPQLLLACSACSQDKSLSSEFEFTNFDDENNLLNKAASTSSSIPDIIKTELPVEQYQLEPEMRADGNSSWKCPICTLINRPLSLACSVCSHEKPLSLEEKTTISDELKNLLLDNRNFNQLDMNNIIEEIVKPTAEVNMIVPIIPQINVLTTLKRETPSIYQHLATLTLDTIDVVHNTELFDCPICYTDVEADEGCVLRDCLHTFCRDCLTSTIQYSDDVEIKCPYANGEYSCDSLLQDCEIRALVSLEIYEKHLAKSIRYAEHKMKNSFHCKQPNCEGWCICEDGVNQFDCPVCEHTNCLICQVIHHGKSCYEYQGELNRNGQIKIETESTKEMINQMVIKGQVMNCPTCQVIITKLSGCDWLQCLICKTEVCWATRKPRRGPGGCRCRENGVKCHPNCQNCH